ncbi:hypothetical protein CC80DRAFT_75827 [Byssothecium circinans]|uniref:Uncharacterized protein n=1 Tax=Byssothecium circinans TaxID=147558 RepID=A0A6A5U069_9PLEO|nr:hypothetical protein CC80DRAFT_75827 [Byssothecium circinans]
MACCHSLRRWMPWTGVKAADQSASRGCISLACVDVNAARKGKRKSIKQTEKGKCGLSIEPKRLASGALGRGGRREKALADTAESRLPLTPSRNPRRHPRRHLARCQRVSHSHPVRFPFPSPSPPVSSLSLSCSFGLSQPVLHPVSVVRAVVTSISLPRASHGRRRAH